VPGRGRRGARVRLRREPGESNMMERARFILRPQPKPGSPGIATAEALHAIDQVRLARLSPRNQQAIRNRRRCLCNGRQAPYGVVV
jgi:hypothetical protein